MPLATSLKVFRIALLPDVKKKHINSFKADIFLIGCVIAATSFLHLTRSSTLHNTGFICTREHVCLWEVAWLLLCARACACAQSSQAKRTIFVSVGEKEKKAKYPGVCSHGYYHDVGGAGLLSQSCASLSHSLKVALADESLHSMLLAQTHQPTHPASQSARQGRRCVPLYKHVRGDQDCVA